MINKLKIFGRAKDIYSLVTIRKYDGVENGAQAWTFLSYAIVKDLEDNKAVCYRNENIEYEYIKAIEPHNNGFYDYSDVNIGDIRIFKSFVKEFSSIAQTNKALNKFINDSGLYFDEDTKYGKDMSEGNNEVKTKFKK